MLKTKRMEKIKEYIFDKGTVSLKELVETFDVSKNTIRRDVDAIVTSGNFKKVYGGVAIDNSSRTVPYGDRKIYNYEEKKKISRVAASFIKEDDIVFIDSGTTTVEMFDYLKEKELTIITNNIDFIVRALPYDNLNVISMGGTIERETNSFASVHSAEVLADYNISKAFLASTGVSIEKGATNSLALESPLKKTVVKESAASFLLVDHSKFDKVSLITYSELSDFDYIVTDDIPTHYKQYIADHEVKLVIS